MTIVHEGHTDPVSSVAFSPDGKSVASGSGDHTVRVWDAQSSAPISEPLRGHGDLIYSVSYSPLGSIIASASGDKTIRLWDTITGQQSGLLRGNSAFLSVAFSPYATLIASGSGPTVQLWDVQKIPASRAFMGHTGQVASVSFSPDGTRLVSGSSDKTIRVWDVERGVEILEPLEGHTDGVRSITISPDGTHIASCSWDGTLRLWDSRNGALIGEPLKDHTGPVWSVAFSPRGTYVASGGGDQTVRLWDIRTGRQKPFRNHTSIVTSVVFSPCGQYIASGSCDYKVIIEKVLGDEAYSGDIGPQAVTSQMYTPGTDGEEVTIDAASLISKVLPMSSNSPTAPPEVPPGVPFMGLKTGFDAPSFSKVEDQVVSVQSKYIEQGLDNMREKNLLKEADEKARVGKKVTTRIRPILEVGEDLKEEVTKLRTIMRGTGGRELNFIDRVRAVIDGFEALLKVIHLRSARSDTSYESFLGMSLSVLATLASSLFSSPESGKAGEYFRLSKRSLMIATRYLPEAHPTKPVIASHWGTLYFQRFQLFGNSNHIDQAIKFHEQSVVLVSEQPMLRSLLGRSYLARFEDSQSADDLQKGVEANSKALKAIESKAEKATEEEKKHALEGASRGLQCLIEHIGESNSISLINTGIAEWRNTLLDLFKDEKVTEDLKASCMRTLGFLYLTRFGHAGSQDSDDLKKSLTFLGAAVALRPERHPELLSTLCVFAHSLAAKTRDVHVEPDLAPKFLKLSLDFLDLAKSLLHSQSKLQSKPGEPGEPAPFESHLLASFGDLHMFLSNEGADEGYLNSAIEYYNNAFHHDTCHPGSRLWAKVRQQLGLCKFYQYKRSGSRDTKILRSALAEFIHIALSPVGHLFDRFTAACSWATSAASHPAFRRHALYGYETALESIPLLACFGAVPEQRRRATQRAGRLASEAAATAMAAGENTLALVLLERGRSIKWNSMLQLRSPLRALKFDPRGKDLAEELELLLKRLQDPTEKCPRDLKDLGLLNQYQDLLGRIRKVDGFGDFMMPKRGEDLAKAAQNGPVVVINVHDSGCHALIVHPSNKTLHSPGKALECLLLPDLTVDRIIEMQAAITQALKTIGKERGADSNPNGKKAPKGTKELEAELKKLWDWAVKPILKQLEYLSRETTDEEPQRVTWCATGALSFLPLHAAGNYAYGSKEKVFRYAVSSYTPTLSALLPDSRCSRKKLHSDILLVDPEPGSKNKPLPGAKVELDCIVQHFNFKMAMATESLPRQFASKLENLDWSPESASKSSADSKAQTDPQFALDMDGVSDDETGGKFSHRPKDAKKPQNRGRCTRLDGPNATADKVYEEMQKHDWVHLACHATQNNGDPSKCGFCIGDELLSLQRIAQMDYKQRGLAFLSACQSAEGDEHLPDEALHLASGVLMAGYTSVIATLWPVKDRDAPYIANFVYKRLLVNEGMRCDNSALALHAALDKLREKDDVCLPDWISFVHFGAA